MATESMPGPAWSSKSFNNSVFLRHDVTQEKGNRFDHFVKQKSRLGLCRLCAFGNMREDSANEWPASTIPGSTDPFAIRIDDFFGADRTV